MSEEVRYCEKCGGKLIPFLQNRVPKKRCPDCNIHFVNGKWEQPEIPSKSDYERKLGRAMRYAAEIRRVDAIAVQVPEKKRYAGILTYDIEGNLKSINAKFEEQSKRVEKECSAKVEAYQMMLDHLKKVRMEKLEKRKGILNCAIFLIGISIACIGVFLKWWSWGY